jgi:hypothetical protein
MGAPDNEALSLGGKPLRAHRTILRIALSIGTIFGWITVFRVFQSSNDSVALSLAGTVLLYALSQAIVLVVTPLSGAALRFGTRRSLVYGTLFALFSFASLTLLYVPMTIDTAYMLIATFAIMMGLHRALYWIPYATLSEPGPTGYVLEILISCMPLLGALALVLPAGPVFFASVTALVALSLMPLVYADDRLERFSWRYRETFAELFSPLNAGPLVLLIADGIQGVTLLLLWPMTVYLLLDQSYVMLGLILTLTLLLALFLKEPVRRIFRYARIGRSHTALAIIVFASWLARLGVGTPLQVLAADLAHHALAGPRRFAIDTLSFDQAADGGHFVDEYTALKEMGMAIGRLIACGIFVTLVLFTAPVLACAVLILIAAFSGAGSVVLSRRLMRAL